MWRHQHPSLALPIHTTNTTSWYTRVNKALGLSSWTIFLVNTKIICWICFEDSRFLYYFWTIPINILYMYTPAECVVLPGKWYTWKRTSENMQLVRCGGKKVLLHLIHIYKFMRVFDWFIFIIVGKKKSLTNAGSCLWTTALRYFLLFSRNAIPYTMLESSRVQCYIHWTVTLTMRLKLFVYCVHDERCCADCEIHWTKQIQKLIEDYFWIIKMLHVILKSVEMWNLLWREKLIENLSSRGLV